MGVTSGQVEDDYFARRDVTMGIAVTAGLLRQSEWCGTVLEGDRTRREDAYRIGNAKFTRGELAGVFGTRREMTDAVKDVENEHGLNSCPRCDTLLKD